MKISNRGTYTNVKKAQWYVDRELAVPIAHDEAGRMIEIHMLEAAEIAMIRSAMVREKRVENQDDGIQKRWTRVASGRSDASEAALDGKLIDGHLIVTSPGGLPVLQLRPVKQVGTGSAVSKFKDMLTRRQPRRGPVISLMSPA